MERYKYLLSKYLNNTCDKAELNEFISWVKSPENESELRKLIAEDWSNFTINEAHKKSSGNSFDQILQKIGAEHSTNIRTESEKQIKLKRSAQYSNVLLRIAASFLLPIAIGASSFYFMKSFDNSSDLALTRITAPNGSKSQVVLSDGTSIWLNSGSTLEYPQTFTRKSREVKLSGEGYFDVAKNPDKPFIVQTSDLRIKVLGTIFNVKSYPDEGTIETTLIEGSVAITNSDEKRNTKNIVYLKPNERATFIREEGKIIQSVVNSGMPKNENTGGNPLPRKEQMILSKITDSEQYTSWKDEKLSFRNENFEKLCIMLERWYNVKINIHSEELKQYHYTGTLQNENIVDAIEAFKLTMPLRYEINRDVIEIWQTNDEE